MRKKIVVILGNQLKLDRIHTELRERMETGMKAFRKENADLMILSGGSTNPNFPRTESELMMNYAIDHGIDKDRIIVEKKSKDTIGNGFFTRVLIDTIDDGKDIFIVSSCYHMERVRYIFTQCYDKKYQLNFDYCCPYDENIDHEQESMEEAKLFFKHIKRGNVAEIRKKLCTKHKLYSQAKSS